MILKIFPQESSVSLPIKGTVSRDFLHFFLLSKNSTGPLITSKNNFAKYFDFTQICIGKSVHIVVDYADTVLSSVHIVNYV